MSQYNDNGFASAQRAYDNQVPDWYDQEETSDEDMLDNPNYESLCCDCDTPTLPDETCSACGSEETYWHKIE